MALASGVAVTFGLLTTSVQVHNAIERATTTHKQVCTGYGADETGALREHDVALVTQPKQCPTCGPIPYTAVKKAQQVGDGYVVLEAEEITAAKADAGAFKKRADLTPHPAEQVEGATVPGEKLYHLTPATGHEATYALLATFVGAHPELAFMGQWTPRSNAAQFRVVVRDGVLCLQERVRAENVKAAPALQLPPVAAPMLGMAEQVLAMPGVVTDYDPATYADAYTAKIAALVASKTPQTAAAPVSADAPAPVTAQDPMAALQAMLASVTPIADAPSAPTTPAKRAPRKAKTAAAKGAA